MCNCECENAYSFQEKEWEQNTQKSIEAENWRKEDNRKIEENAGRSYRRRWKAVSYFVRNSTTLSLDRESWRQMLKKANTRNWL